MLFGTPLSPQFSMGASMILVSVYFFSNPMKTKTKSTPDEDSEMIATSPSGEVLPK
jgi:hypothetical protein